MVSDLIEAENYGIVIFFMSSDNLQEGSAMSTYFNEPRTNTPNNAVAPSD